MDIKTEGLEIAPLTKEQMDNLLLSEKGMNNNRKTGEIYLLAVTRRNA